MLTISPTIPQEDADVDAGIERRRGLRIRQARPIKVFEPTSSRYFGGQTQDVSSTGLRLELPSSMAVRPESCSASTSAWANPANPWPIAAR